MCVCVYVCENVLMLLKILLGKLLENVFILVFIYWLHHFTNSKTI